MIEHPNAAAIRSAYAAVERGDMEAFAAALDDDIVWHESMPGFEGTYRGRDQALALLGRVSIEHWHLPLDPGAEAELFAR